MSKAELEWQSREYLTDEEAKVAGFIPFDPSLCEEGTHGRRGLCSWHHGEGGEFPYELAPGHRSCDNKGRAVWIHDWNHPNATRKGFWRLSMCPRHAKLHAGKYCLMELLEYRGEADKIKPPPADISVTW